MTVLFFKDIPICLKFDGFLIDLLFCFQDFFVILCWSKQCYTVKQLSYSSSELKKKLRALHLNLWKPLSPCQGEIGSVDNPNIFNFVLSDTEEMCQQWAPTASKHRSLTSNNLDSTLPPVLSHRRFATFISFRSRSVDQKWRLSPAKQKTQVMRMFSRAVPHIIEGYACVWLGQYRLVWYHLWIIDVLSPCSIEVPVYECWCF